MKRLIRHLLMLLILPSPLWGAGGLHLITGINAHGGCVIQVDSVYYWYGENRPYEGFTTQVGVEVYTSRDLMTWHDAGACLRVSETAGSPIERGCIIERPKVVYCQRTQQYVMLFHLERKGRGYEAAQVGFAVSKSPEGPFQFLHALRPNAEKWPREFTRRDIKKALQQRPESYKEWWTPAWREAIRKGMFTARDYAGGQMSRDQTVYVDRDQTAYQITSSEDNLTLHINELTPDYLGFTGRYTRLAPGGQNEAPCMTYHDGTYWLITSGCTGWAPNEARMFSAKSIWGPYTQHPTPFRGPDAHKTFGAQGAYIFGDHFLLDVWTPQHLSESPTMWLTIRYENGVPVIER